MMKYKEKTVGFELGITNSRTITMVRSVSTWIWENIKGIVGVSTRFDKSSYSLCWLCVIQSEQLGSLGLG